MPAGRKIITLSLDADLVEEARNRNINAALVAERALAQKINEQRSETERAELKRRFQEENAEAFAAANAYVEKHGIPLAKYRQF
jgi:antitoxin CcdA